MRDDSIETYKILKRLNMVNAVIMSAIIGVSRNNKGLEMSRDFFIQPTINLQIYLLSNAVEI